MNAVSPQELGLPHSVVHNEVGVDAPLLVVKIDEHVGQVLGALEGQDKGLVTSEALLTAYLPGS